MKKFNMSIPLAKVDEEKHLVYGRATQEVLDKSGEVMDYETSKPFFVKWSNDFAEKTNGKSYGNIREQHDPQKAVGKIVEPIKFNDEEKAIDICAKIVDEGTWGKVKECVLTGFSIGGRYEDMWEDKDHAIHFTADPFEISIVDSPCVPTATIEYVKADGSSVKRTIHKKEDKALDKTTEALDNLIKAIEAVKPLLNEANKTIEDEKAEAEPELKKADEPEAEPVDEPQEELKEDAAEADEPQEDMSKAAEPEAEKANELEDCFKACEKAITKENADKCGALYHAIKAAGFACTCKACTGEASKANDAEATKADAGEALHKAQEGEEVSKADDAMQKAMSMIADMKKSIDALKSDNDALKAQVKKLEDEPMPGGAIAPQGVAPMDKSVGMDSPQGKANESNELQKMFEEETDPVVKQAIGKKLAKASMLKIFTK